MRLVRSYAFLEELNACVSKGCLVALDRIRNSKREENGQLERVIISSYILEHDEKNTTFKELNNSLI